jgi:hypothetical protein
MLLEDWGKELGWSELWKRWKLLFISYANTMRHSQG